jgi:hypothetical protein
MPIQIVVFARFHESRTKLISKEESLARVKMLVDRLKRITMGQYGEGDTIIGFFVPILEYLGWDVPNGVGTELHFQGYANKTNVAGGLPDCILSINGRPYASVEIKGLARGSVDKEKNKEQLFRYFLSTGCRIGVLTRVYETQIYLPNKTLVAGFSNPDQYLSKFDELWKWLSKEGATYMMNRELGK